MTVITELEADDEVEWFLSVGLNGACTFEYPKCYTALEARNILYRIIKFLKGKGDFNLKQDPQHVILGVLRFTCKHTFNKDRGFVGEIRNDRSVWIFYEGENMKL